MTPREVMPWEARLFRFWIRLLGTRLTRRFEEELVALFCDRLRAVESSRAGRLSLLVRSAVDAVRHGGADAVPGVRRERRERRVTGKGRGDK